MIDVEGELDDLQWRRRDKKTFLCRCFYLIAFLTTTQHRTMAPVMLFEAATPDEIFVLLTTEDASAKEWTTDSPPLCLNLPQTYPEKILIHRPHSSSAFSDRIALACAIYSMTPWDPTEKKRVGEWKMRRTARRKIKTNEQISVVHEPHAAVWECHVCSTPMERSISLYFLMHR